MNNNELNGISISCKLLINHKLMNLKRINIFHYSENYHTKNGYHHTDEHPLPGWIHNDDTYIP